MRCRAPCAVRPPHLLRKGGRLSKQTKVEWTGTPLPAGHPLWKTYPSGVFPGATFNPWIGCEPTSPGCKNCYAWALAKRSPQLVYGKPLGPLHGLPVWGAAARDEPRLLA